MDRNELKVQALLEKISNLTTNYENQIADMRVDYTLLSQDRDQLREQLDNLDSNMENSDEVVHEITSVPSENSH